jgi:hypothetical protein
MTMNQLKKTKASLAAAAAASLLTAAATLGLGGCSESHKATMAKNRADAGDAFLAPEEGSEVSRLNDTQMAAGARTDSTLRAYHFRRGALNSLGRQKLDRMIAANEADAADVGGDEGEAMVVYLDAAAGAAASEETAKRLGIARQAAVTDYLMSRGLTEDMFRIQMGYNPDDTFLASSAAGSAGAAEAGAAAPAGGLSAPAAAGAPGPGGMTTK